MNKKKYVAAIVTLFKEEGLSLSMDAIAERIGVTKKTLYNRFSSREGLIDCCIDAMNEELRENISCLSDENVPAPEGFSRGITGLKDTMYGITHVFMRDLMSVYPQKAASDHAVGSALFEDMLRQNIERGKAAGIYRQSIDAGLFSKYISYSIFSFFFKNIMRGGAWSSDSYFRQVIDFNINALIDKQ